MTTVDDAYSACERITHAQAANFFYGIRLLPATKRRSMCAIYAFARRVDDIGDGELAAAEKLRALDSERAALGLLAAAEPLSDPVLIALRDTHARVELPLDALHSLIDGVEADARGKTYATFEELVVYCRQVAGSIGRLSLAIFGATTDRSGAPDRQHAAALADDLGVAMQLTNILRDVREDRDRGRVYLPREDFERFGCTLSALTPAQAGMLELIRFQARRNREWFAHGLQLLPLLDGRSAACVAAMTGIYRRILERIEREPGAVLERRVSLPTWEKAWVAARSLARSANGTTQHDQLLQPAAPEHAR